MNIDVRVFSIPGGGSEAFSAYEKLAKFLEMHDDLILTVYRVQNRYDGKWKLILIGEKTSLSQYLEAILQSLSEVQAQSCIVPPESLIPFIERFFAMQTEMHRTKTSFVKKHHAKKKASYRSKKRRK